MRLPGFCCATCGGIEAGNGWPSDCRSTPELNRLQADLSALMPYREAADVLAQMLPLDAGKNCETLRRYTLKIGEALRNAVASRPPTTASAQSSSVLAGLSASSAARRSMSWSDRDRSIAPFVRLAS